VWEHPYYPQYYLPSTAFPEDNERGVKLEYRGPIKDSRGLLIAEHKTLVVGDRSVPCITFTCFLSGAAAPLKGLTKINFDAVDRWFEEDAPIHMHPKDPFKRIDILPSTRRVQVFDRKGGKQLADAASSMHLYETGLPVRYYLPLTAVDASLLRPSATKTQCPYKGEAEYYSVELPGGGGVLKDAVWYYDRPIMESAKIEGEFFLEWLALNIVDANGSFSQVSSASTARKSRSKSMVNGCRNRSHSVVRGG
jgi:uncharacterized protein (DUF427 family)